MADKAIIEQRGGFTLATIMARKATALDALERALKLAPPAVPSTVSNGTLTLIGTGPGMWLALGDGSEAAAPAELSRRLAGLAAVADQSSGYTIFRLAGPCARTLLQRGAPIDLHPLAFSPGSAAGTVIAHMGVIFWQVDDLPTYDVAVFRSFSKSFRHWLDAGVAAL